MKVAIIGSWRDGDREWGLRGSHAEFENACLAIGRQLGSHRQKIVVGGQSLATADLHVVRGLVETARHMRVSGPLVEVMRPAGDASSYEDLARQFPGLFEFHVPTQARWAEAHLLSLREADVVIAIAGMKGTYQAGLAALVAKKRLVPVASFGGAAAKLSAAIDSIGEGSDRSDLRQLNGPWSEKSHEVVARIAGIGQLARVLLIHGRSQDWLHLKDWLRETLGVPKVIVMAQEFGAGRTLPEKFEQLAAEVDVAIAVATPDDRGGLAGLPPDQLRYRARQNVWLEVGWFWGRLGRSRVMLLTRGGIEPPSDLSGIEMYEYSQVPTESSEKIRAFLSIGRGVG